MNSKFYPSINEAGRKLKVDPQTISSALKSGGYFRRQKDGVRFRAALAVEPAPADLPEREIKRKPRSAPKKLTEKKQPQKFLGKNNFPGEFGTHQFGQSCDGEQDFEKTSRLSIASSR